MEDCWLGRPQSDVLASLSATCRVLADDAETTAAVWFGLALSSSCNAMVVVASQCNKRTYTIDDIYRSFSYRQSVYLLCQSTVKIFRCYIEGQNQPMFQCVRQILKLQRIS